MRVSLLLVIASMTIGFNAMIVFFALFTFGYLGSGWGQMLAAGLGVALAAAVTGYGMDRWRKVRRGEQVRV